jgi:hypothetical protein
MKTPNRTLTVELNGNNYKLEFGNTGDLIDMETVKQKYANGHYNSMANSRTAQSMYASFLIDAFATFSTLCPSMVEDLRVRTLRDLDLISGKKLVDLYMSKVLPWINEWMSVLDKAIDEENRQVAEQEENEE